MLGFADPSTPVIIERSISSTFREDSRTTIVPATPGHAEVGGIGWRHAARSHICGERLVVENRTPVSSS